METLYLLHVLLQNERGKYESKIPNDVSNRGI